MQDVRRLDLCTSKIRHLGVARQEDLQPVGVPPGFGLWEGGEADGALCYKKSWKTLWREVRTVVPPSRLFRNIIDIDLSGVLEELLAPFIGITGQHPTKLSIE